MKLRAVCGGVHKHRDEEFRGHVDRLESRYTALSTHCLSNTATNLIFTIYHVGINEKHMNERDSFSEQLLINEFKSINALMSNSEHPMCVKCSCVQ